MKTAIIYKTIYGSTRKYAEWLKTELKAPTYEIDKVSVTKIVDNLEKRGLVYREPDENDRRIKRIVLSSEGRELVPRLKKVAFKTLSKAFEHTKQKDRESFMIVLSQIVKNFTGEDILSFINNNKGRWK